MQLYALSIIILNKKKLKQLKLKQTFNILKYKMWVTLSCILGV